MSQSWSRYTSNLWTLNCTHQDGTDRLCVTDCTNASSITSSLVAAPVLWECAYYLNVTNDFRLDLLSDAQKSTLTKDKVDTSLARAGAVTSTISSCLSAFCESLEECKQKSPQACSATALSINGSMLNADSMDTCIHSICTSHPSPLTNTDIAGIGIVTSYIIQFALVLLGALVLVVLKFFWKAGSRYASTSCSSPLREAAEPHPGLDPTKYEYNAVHRQESNDREESDIQQALETQGDAESEQAESQLKRFGAPELYNAVIVALVEFLKAQCFVAMAVSIAALIVLNSRTETSLLDTTALGAASGISIVPITFNYYVLATFNTDRNDPKRKSLYLYGLCFVSWVLGLCVVLSPQMFAENRQKKIAFGMSSSIQFNSQFPNACGNASPQNICAGTQVPDVHPEYAFYYTLCLPVMLGLTIWQLTTLPSVSTFLTPFFYKDTKPLPLRFTLLHLSALGFFAAPFCFFFINLSDLFFYKAVSFDWSFGQIIAITLWVPSVAGFVNNVWDGVGPALTKQLPVGYSAVKNALRKRERRRESRG